MNQDEINMLVQMKKSGLSYNDIREKTGICLATIAKYCRGITSHREGCIIRANKNIPLSDKTREKLSMNAIKRIAKSKKIWTSPEQKMFYKFIDNGYIVRFSKNIEEYNSVNIDIKHDIIFQGEVQRYCVDFLDEKNKICYEINGNYWHANPKIYKVNLTECQKWNIYRDKNKKQYLESKGYKVITIWEDEIDSFHLESRDKNINEDYMKYVKTCVERMSSMSVKKQKSKTCRVMPKCVDCGCELKWIKACRCTECNKKHLKDKSYGSMKFVVSKEQLEKDLQEMTMVSIGKKYGVSDKAIRKRCKRLGIMRDSYNG